MRRGESLRHQQEDVMNAYLYRFGLRPEDRVSVEIRVTAPSVVVARRVVHGFLAEHDGEAWAVECVSRETSADAPLWPIESRLAKRAN
jgi:hypothetical protein